MTLDQFANLAEIIGLILIIASLVYVAQQLRQNTNMLRAESRNEIQHTKQQEVFFVAQNPEVWRGMTGKELDDENVRLNMFLTASLRAREHEWFQFRYGALDESAWKSYATAIPLVLASERARAWWKSMEVVYDREFVEKANELLDNEPLKLVHKQQVAALADSAPAS